MSPRIGELFAGYGGLGMGVQAVFGGEVAWYSEVDKGALKILQHRFPDVPNMGDVTKVDWSQVEPVDILTGGSPCQDLSHAGKRAGMTEGTRSNLWVAMREAIAQLRPPIVVWENVRGAYSAAADSAGTVVTQRRGQRASSRVVYEGGLLENADGGPTLRALGRVLGDLSELGYDASWHGLRAADIGAPHGRFRVFVIATDTRCIQRGQGWSPGPSEAQGGRAFGDTGGRSLGALGLLPTPTSRDFKNAGDPAKTAARMADRGQPLSEIAVNVLLPTPAVNDMGAAYTPDTWDEWTERMKAEHGNGNGHGKSLAIEAQRLLPTPEAARAGGTPERHLERKRLADGSRRTVCTNLDIVAAADSTSWGDYAAAIARWEHILGRAAPAPTQTSSKGNPQLSPAFVEWMMGLPAGWVTDVPGITRNEALKALGNGVVPQQCAAALRTMLAWGAVA